jgi:transcriptional regulator with XRE-family HTH domain
MVEGQHTPGPAEGKIGLVLERARKDRGLSLEEAERATKIRKRYLIGLEQDDYTVLPDAVYARGFLKTYANFLGLDGDGLSQELRTRKKPRRERRLSYAPPQQRFDGHHQPGASRGEKRKVKSASSRRDRTARDRACSEPVLCRPERPPSAPKNPRGPGRAHGAGPGEGIGRRGRGATLERAPRNVDRGVSGGSTAWIRVRSDSEMVSRRSPSPATLEPSRRGGWSASRPGTRAPSPSR